MSNLLLGSAPATEMQSVTQIGLLVYPPRQVNCAPKLSAREGIKSRDTNLVMAIHTKKRDLKAAGL